jgi:hypothetical protein
MLEELREIRERQEVLRGEIREQEYQMSRTGEELQPIKEARLKKIREDIKKKRTDAISIRDTNVRSKQIIDSMINVSDVIAADE